ncbi:MAG: ATP-binding protein [Haloquadratum sp.]
MSLLPPAALQSAYVFAFAAAAVACFGALLRLPRIEHEDTRRGLYWLLLTGGGWAAAHVGYLVVPTADLKYAFYVAGLIVGWGSIGPWLYFCAAYTGRSIHRDPTVQRIAVGVFLVLVAVKVTNPLHHWYFVAEPATTPFPHLQIHHRPLHWVAMGLAYAFAFVGFFMLFELFVRVNSDTRPLFVLLGVTGLPVVLDVLGAVSPVVLDVTYSPIGVAAFAVGVFWLYFDRFQFVRVAGETDDPIIVLDDGGRIRDYNARAAELFPALSDARNERLSERLPELDATLDSSRSIFETEVGGTTRFYNVSANPFATATARTGQSITLTDVTHREQYRQELEQKNERLEQFASIVSHDLRNPLQVAEGRVELAIEEDDPSHLDAVARALDRIEEIIDEMLTLAREGVSIDDTERVDVAAVAEQSWEMVPSEDATLSVEPAFDLTVTADPERVQQLFENLFRNAIQHGGDEVTVTVGALDGSADESGGSGDGENGETAGFYVADDGEGVPEDEREEIFETGYTTAADGTGFGLDIVSEIVDAHGWEISATESAAGGARFEIRTDAAAA